MKKWIPVLCVCLLLSILLAAAVFFGSRYSISKGRCIVTEGGYMILLEDEPVQMYAEGELFSNLNTGDEIQILHGLIRCTYPGSTDVFYCRRIAGGTVEDIPQDIIEKLCQLGWILTELNEPDVSDSPDTDACDDPEGELARKPVIYLYPEEETPVSVKLEFNGQLTATYPAYQNGWQVLAYPDGTILDTKTGREYYCLFWEGVSNAAYDLSTGFVIPGDQTQDFLEEALSVLGLTEREANEFIIYWLPQMQDNPYNLISFQHGVYTQSAMLTVQPEPDCILRVFMAWQPLEEPVSVRPQELQGFERYGFTVVEWGGACVSALP